MEIEDILSTLGMAVLAIISLVFRAVGNKQRRESKPMTSENSVPSSRSVVWGDRDSAHPDSQETIIDETKGHQRTTRRNVEKDIRVATSKNATNRTLMSTQKSEEAISSNEPIAKKINLRDAVIYSEILAPKFKESQE